MHNSPDEQNCTTRRHKSCAVLQTAYISKGSRQDTNQPSVAKMPFFHLNRIKLQHIFSKNVILKEYVCLNRGTHQTI